MPAAVGQAGSLSDESGRPLCSLQLQEAKPQYMTYKSYKTYSSDNKDF